MIHVVIPSYNCPDEIERCLASIEVQDLARDRYNVVVIDDASPGQRHSRVCEVRASAQGYTFIRNARNFKCPYTIKQGIEASGALPDDVIFLVDGDDFIPPYALTRIEAYYERYPHLWLTYGQYQPHPNGWTTETPATEYPTLVRWERTFRNHTVTRFNHPLTFRRFLWDGLTDADLQDDDGAWFTDGYDQVIMVPMLEMAAPDHYAQLEEVLYYYNSENPISESKLVQQHRLFPRAAQIVKRPKKPQLVR